MQSAAAMATLAAAGIAAAAAHEIPLDERRSDTTFIGADTRAMQDDDTANPGMLAVLDGQALWTQKSGATGKSCADCHGETAARMKGVAAHCPAFVPALGRPVDLQQRINMSRLSDQKAPAWPLESRELLALTTFIARQSRGLPIAVSANAQSRPFIAAGRAIFETRAGQLNIACAQCHDDNWGRRLAGNLVPQAQPTGYPVYRLQWQGRIAAAPPARLHDRDASRALRLRIAGTRRSRILPDVARPRPEDGSAGGAAVGRETPADNIDPLSDADVGRGDRAHSLGATRSGSACIDHVARRLPAPYGRRSIQRAKRGAGR